MNKVTEIREGSRGGSGERQGVPANALPKPKTENRYKLEAT